MAMYVRTATRSSTTVPHRRHASDRRLMLSALVLALVAMASFHGAAVAQDSLFPFPITKFNCEEDPGTIGQAELPDGCVLVEGVSVTVFDGEGNELGSCVTDENGGCIVDVDVPDDGLVVVEEDESTGTPGYTPRENPVEVEIVNEFSEAKIVNLKETKPELPDTGTGDRSTVDSDGAAALLAVVAVVLALCGALMRRPAERG